MKKDKEEKIEKKTLNIIINILIIIITLLIVFCAWKLVEISLSYMESRKEYNELRQYIIPEEEPELVQASTGSGSTEDADALGNGNASEDASGEMSEDSAEKEIACPISVDFQALWAINPDIKGWLYLEEVDISYPIVQGADNDEYLYTSVKGTSNKGGSIFMDAANADDFSDPHTLIYGHNMKDGSMFGHLKKLYDQERIDEMEEPLCFWIITPEGNYRYDIFSIHTVDVSGDAYTLFAEQGDAVGAYMNKMARFTGVALPQRVYNSYDKVVTLSTCTGSDQYRLIVQGVLYVE